MAVADGQHPLGGKSWEIKNEDYDAIKQIVTGGWWDNTMSSIKVWKL